MDKSSVDEIRRRFDADVERFSNLETGQSSTIDATIAMTLVADAAAAATPGAASVLDVGCGAGNYTLCLLGRLPNLSVTLLDLSQPMLDRAVQRITPQTSGAVQAIQGDIRDVELGERRFDVILAACVLHHLRSDGQWRSVLRKLHQSLRAQGTLWVFDLVEASAPAVQQLMWRRYGQYLAELRDPEYRDHVLAYVEREDSPRPLMHQLRLLDELGFADVDVLHKNGCFAAYGARKKAEE